MRSMAKKNPNVYVVTGPLYLPRQEPDGKMYVKYQVIGRNQVSVPTHFFKVTNDANRKIFAQLREVAHFFSPT